MGGGGGGVGGKERKKPDNSITLLSTQILDFVNTVGDVRHSYGKCLAENSPHKADVKS